MHDNLSQGLFNPHHLPELRLCVLKLPIVFRKFWWDRVSFGPLVPALFYFIGLLFSLDLFALDFHGIGPIHGTLCRNHVSLVLMPVARRHPKGIVGVANVVGVDVRVIRQAHSRP